MNQFFPPEIELVLSTHLLRLDVYMQNNSSTAKQTVITRTHRKQRSKMAEILSHSVTNAGLTAIVVMVTPATVQSHHRHIDEHGHTSLRHNQIVVCVSYTSAVRSEIA